MRNPGRAMLVVTHYQRLLNYIVPDYVHVLVDGRIVKSGGPELALDLEDKGYGKFEGGSERLIRLGRTLGSDSVATATSGLQNYEESFSGFEKSAAGRELSWLRDLRQSGFARFSETGFPTTRDEDWRFTNPAAIAQTRFRLARNGHSLPSKEALAAFRVPGAGWQAVFVDGHFAPQLSTIGKLPFGVTVGEPRSGTRTQSGCN